jgi:hypothetical protein
MTIGKALRLAGFFAVVIGLIWAAQGAGYFPYPQSSFMIGETPWIYRGLVLAMAGVVAIVLSRGRRSR